MIRRPERLSNAIAYARHVVVMCLLLVRQHMNPTPCAKGVNAHRELAPEREPAEPPSRMMRSAEGVRGGHVNLTPQGGNGHLWAAPAFSFGCSRSRLREVVSCLRLVDSLVV